MGAILVTGAAGFIGSHVSEMLLKRGEHVIGYDNLDPYYDPRIKRRNVNALSDSLNFTFIEGDIRDPEKLNHVIKTQGVDRIIHLAPSPMSVSPSIAPPISPPSTSAAPSMCWKRLVS